MSLKVVIKQLGAGAIGEVTQEAAGLLQMRAYQTDLQAQLQSLVDHIAQSQFAYISGSSEEIDGKIVHKTVSKAIGPEDPVYLNALADAITKARLVVAGKRVRAYVMGD